jgi:hypothetical protein
MSNEAPAYGLWSLVLINSVVFILFAYSFFKPQTARDWRSFGAFSAFLVALFVEMYGFPLTIYFLSGWLQSRFPNIDWFSHDAGHLLEMMFGWKANPHAGPFHILSFVFIGGGFVLISAAWKVLYDAQQDPDARHHRAVQLRTTSAICWVYHGDVRFPAAMADHSDTGDVSGAGGDVCPARACRGPGREGGIWRGVREICGRGARFHSETRPGLRKGIGRRLSSLIGQAGAWLTPSRSIGA